MTLFLPTERAASTTNTAIAAGAYWLSMTLIAGSATTVALIGIQIGSQRAAWAVVGFALLALAGSALRWWPGQPPVSIIFATVTGAFGIWLASSSIAIEAAGFGRTDSYFNSGISVASVFFAALIWHTGVAALSCTVALLLSETLEAIAVLSNGGVWAFDPASVITCAVLVTVLIVLEFARRQGRGSATSFDRADEGMVAAETRHRAGLRSTAILHDTVLGDLTTLATTAPGALDQRTTARLLDTVCLLRSGAWMAESAAPAEGDLSQLVETMGMAGIRVTTTGDESVLDRLPAETSAEVLRAIEQLLRNVVAHAEASEVDISVMSTGDEVSIMVTDDGVGFDPERDNINRLGLRTSVRGRIEGLGGTTTVWSSPGSGTSVLLSIPNGPETSTAAEAALDAR